MAKVTSQDLTNFYDFGSGNNPANENQSNRMYFDINAALGNNFLMFVDSGFNIVSSYQGWPGSSIDGVAPHIIEATDVCVLNDQGLNSFRSSPKVTNPIYRMYLAQRAITVNIPTEENLVSIVYEGADGQFIVGQSVTNGTATATILTDTPGVGAGQGTLVVYNVSGGVFAPLDTITSGGITANVASVADLGPTIIDIPTEYDCSLLIVNQNFEIDFIVPMVEATVPLQTLAAGSICCSYDYGKNAEAANRNYIWHLYVGDYTINDVPVANCLLIVNQDFKVTCYQVQI